MPQLGEIKRGYEVGYKWHGKRIWVVCPQCGTERWVCFKNGKPESKLCRHCHCSNLGKSRKGVWGYEVKGDYRYKGGRVRTTEGYIRVRVYPDDFFYPMASSIGYVMEHRLVMAKALGRNLHLWELVHHKDGVAKDDNRIEVLQLVTDDRHKQITILESRIKYLEKHITLLEAENVLLREQLNATNQSQ